MSAHDRAPGFRRPQLATPAHTATPRGSEMPARSGSRPVVRRKALFVAAATLCAPALAALALAAIGATGGGGHDAIGSFAGTEGLRGTTTPSVSAPSPDSGPLDSTKAKEKSLSSDSTASHHAQKHPAPQAPARPPAHQAPATPPHHVKPAPNTNVTTPTLPAYDPSQPGAPNSSGTTDTTGGTSGSGTGTTSGTSGSGSSGTDTSGSGSSSYGGSGGSVDGFDAYPGGG
jgi:hypothetical protein